MLEFVQLIVEALNKRLWYFIKANMVSKSTIVASSACLASVMIPKMALSADDKAQGQLEYMPALQGLDYGKVCSPMPLLL